VKFATPGPPNSVVTRIVKRIARKIVLTIYLSITYLELVNKD